jgi:hypothetical protein
VQAPAAGIPVKLGAVLSILTVAEADCDNPAELVAEHVSVTPAVSLVSVVAEQPVDELMADSGS